MRTPHHSIGDVLNELRDEFPDVTISKIRFLESQGLIAPERTPSGYRKFYEPDVARLRWILRQQKDHFLPLKVIKDRLDAMSPDDIAHALEHGDPIPSREEREEKVVALFETARREAAAVEADRVAAAVAASADGGSDDDRLDVATGVSLTSVELATAAGLDDAQLAELEDYGLVVPLAASRDGEGRALFGEEALAIARVAGSFMRFGIEARHLRMYRAFVEREITLFDQVLLPYRRQRNPEAQHKADELYRELAGLGRRLRAALLQQSLRQQARDHARGVAP